MKTNENMKNWIENLIIALVLIIFIENFIISPFIVNGTSMENFLNNGDIVFALNKRIINFLFNKDILIKDFIKNRVVILNIDNEYLIKRVVGVEGDTLIFANNQECDTIIVPQKHIFVLGDNFRNSYDSRQIGCIDYKNINGILIGKTF